MSAFNQRHITLLDDYDSITAVIKEQGVEKLELALHAQDFPPKARGIL